MKKSKYSTGILIFTLSTLLIGCQGAANNSSQSDTSEQISKSDSTGTSADSVQGVSENDTTIEAVYLKNDYGDLFVNLKSESPFTGTILEEILDEDQAKLTREDMTSGDVYLVYGDGIMLESYPGQYPGITKLVRKERGNTEYTEKYGEYLDQFCPAPDTSTPPELTVEYRQPDAAVGASVSRGGYQWSVAGEDGQVQSTAADSLPVLDWDDELLMEQKISGETQFTLDFAYEPQSVKVISWPVEDRNADGESVYPDGEEVVVETVENEAGKTRFAFAGQPQRVYQITGTWSEGTADYGFFTSEIPS